MKRYFFLLLAVTLAVGSYAAKNLNAQQSKLRSDMMTFLKEEGFMPEIDDDGDILFKREGKRWYISVSATDESPMYIALERWLGYDDEYSYERIANTLPTVNSYKGVKVRLNKEAYCLAAEMFVVNAEPMKYAFYKLASQIESMADRIIALVDDDMDIAKSIEFSAAYVANVDKDDNIIDTYGAKIESYRTKYLKLKFYGSVKKAGTYTFNVKFFNAAGVLTTNDKSPAGYSYSVTRNLETGYKEVVLSTWGSNTAGYWPKGTYRAEIYMNNTKIGEKTFTVY